MKALLLTLLVLLPATHRASMPASGIEGRVIMKEKKLQRVASPYAGSGAANNRQVKPLPTLVFINGAVGIRPSMAAKTVLAQRDTAFEPELLIVPVGATVSFPNQDPFFHNVFSYSKPKRFDLGRYPRGESKTVTFDQPGMVSVFCEIHKWMRAGVVVVENSHYAQVNPDGSFALPDVPPGSYKLTVWQAERGARTVDVTVPAAGAARVDVTF